MDLVAALDCKVVGSSGRGGVDASVGIIGVVD